MLRDRCRLSGLWALVPRFRARLHACAYVVLLVLARPSDAQDVLTAVLLLAGLVLRVWALGCITKDQVLCTWGPYRYTRNPLYLANLVIGLGLIVNANHWLATVISAVVLGVAYTVTIATEERRLRDLFGEQYAEYCRVTPRLFPVFRPREAFGPGVRFGWRRALSAGLITQVIALLLLVCCMESKEEYLEWRGVPIPITYGVTPIDLAPGRSMLGGSGYSD